MHSRTANTGATSTRVSVGATREAAKPWASFGEFTRAVITAAANPVGFDVRLHAAEPTVDRSVGYLVPPPLMRDLTAVSAVDHPALARATTDTTTSFRYIGVMPDDSVQNTGGRYGAFVMSPVPDDQQYPYRFPKYRAIQMELERSGVIVPVTNELLEDSPFAENSIRETARRAMLWQDEDEMVNGNGVGRFLGFAKSSARIEVAIESGQTLDNTATHAKKNAANMLKRARHVARSCFFTHADIYASLIEADLIRDADADAPCGRFATRPIFPLQVAATPGTVGDFLLADASDYLVVSRGAAEYAKSIHVLFDRDESLLRFTTYRNGQPITSGPVTPPYGSNTKSSCVALAARS